MGFLQGKRALVVGVASSRSIAWGIARALSREGAELALTYQNERLAPRVRKLAVGCSQLLTLPCDVSDEEQIEALFTALSDHWNGLDIIVHSVAYAPRGQLEGDYLDSITREGFNTAQEISAYSFAALAKGRPAPASGKRLTARAQLSGRGPRGALLQRHGSGESESRSQRALHGGKGRPGKYPRQRDICGPHPHPAAKGIAHFNSMLDYGERNSPLRRNVTLDEVGNAAAFLCSNLASGITGEILYVDSGYHITSMEGAGNRLTPPERPESTLKLPAIS